MRNNKNKILIIVLISVIIALLVGGFAYIFFATDVFRTGQQLFAKYLTQNLEQVSQNMSMEKIDGINEKLKQNKYEESTLISYAQEEEADPIVQVTIDSQNDSINKKNYGIIGLLIKGADKPFQVEYMTENDAYSLRFSQVIKQFLTVENSNLQELAIKLGMDEYIANELPDSIDFEKISLEKIKLTKDEINTEISKYAKLLYNNISKEKYAKAKNTIITLNGKTTTTNAYSLTLSNEDLKSLSIAMLNAIKQDEIILAKLQTIDEMLQEYIEEPIKDILVEAIQAKIEELNTVEDEDTTEVENEKNIKITVYEQNGKTVRVKLEQELDSVTLDTFEVDGKKRLEINSTTVNFDNTQNSIKVAFIRESENKLNIQTTYSYGEEQQISEISIELLEEENNIKLNIDSSNEYGSILIARDINFVEEIDYKVELNNSNNLILNNMSQDRINYVFEALGPQLLKVYVEPLKEQMTSIQDIESNQPIY